MKKYILLLLSLFLFVSCDKKSKVEKAVEEIAVETKLHRFEQAFFDAKPQELQKIKQEYPDFFPAETPDAVWIEKMQHPQWRELYGEVQKRYKDFSSQQQEIEELFKHIKYYFPTIKMPEIYTAIGDMDYLNKCLYANDKLIIPLELYLGKSHRYYEEFPQYLREGFEPRQILPDIVQSFAYGITPVSQDKSFLALMINSGKDLYIKDILLPNYTDAEKMTYTPEQIKWCEENESYVWEYFIEKKLLYSTDSKLPNRFINPAPFSKFYLEIDNETPGRVGQYIGWQIVRSYMQNHDKTSVTELLRLDANTIFEQSKYKPKKNE